MAVASTIDKVIKLLNDGYGQYSGEVDQSVYDGLNCRKEKQARWFVRVTPKRRIMVCIGCNKGCALTNSLGFQAVLPVESVHSTRISVGVLPFISDDELLEKKTVLTLREVMSVCRIKERKARSLIDDGVLVATQDLPLRVHSGSVREYLDKIR